MSMSLIGYGTWVDREDPSIMKLATQNALEIGYRHFDTAFNYGTEPFVVESIIQSNIPREEIFLTSKSDSPPSIEQLKLGLKN